MTTLHLLSITHTLDTMPDVQRLFSYIQTGATDITFTSELLLSDINA